jgi:hypothetical protein
VSFLFLCLEPTEPTDLKLGQQLRGPAEGGRPRQQDGAGGALEDGDGGARALGLASRWMGM